MPDERTTDPPPGTRAGSSAPGPAPADPAAPEPAPTDAPGVREAPAGPWQPRRTWLVRTDPPPV